VETPVVDDGRRPTILSSLVRKLSQLAASPKAKPPVPVDSEPEPNPLERGPVVELQASLPNKLDIPTVAFEHFLSSLSLCREPIAFEILGTHQKVIAQFASGENDAPLLRRQLEAYFPEATFLPHENGLVQALAACTGDEMLTVEFGLKQEFMLPLASGRLDPFIGIIGALAELQMDELGLFQVLFQPVENPWAESIVDSVTSGDGKPLFDNAPELTKAAQNKVARPLYAVVVRIMACAGQYGRTLQLAIDLAGALRVFAQPGGNELIPLRNTDYPFDDHIEDVLRRQSRRTGMLLNCDELTGFAHLPTNAVRSRVFQRQTAKTKAAPRTVRSVSGLLLGSNEHAGDKFEVRLSPEQRVHHTHIIGASGTGKSTLLFNSVKQSIEDGEGIAVLDPHGDLIDRILGIIPESRISDVVLVDPADEEYAVGFNILSAHSNLEKNLLASDLVAVFQRLSTSWGDQMNSVLQNAILALLESGRGGTIADLRRFLIEAPFRKEFLKSVKDSEVVYYWQKSFPLLTGNKSIGSIITRLDTFLAQKPIRHMVSQPENRLDFAHIMDSGKILLAKLPEGLLGRENSYLLGTLLVSKFQQIAMSRQAQQIESRRFFNIVIDEFANFITPSMAEILSGARKYRIGLTLAHHELHQLQRSPEVASAVMTHPYTRIVFRVGDDDAKKLADGFSYFESQDLRNLETGHAIARVERSDFDFNLEVPLPEKPDFEAAKIRRQQVITASRNKYALRRAEVEAIIEASRTPPPDELPPISPPSKPVDPKPPTAPVSSLPPPVLPIVSLPPTPVSPPTPTLVEPQQAAVTPAAEQLTARPPSFSEVLKAVPPRAIEKTEVQPEVRQEQSQGRGGAEHKSLQKQIAAEAVKLGFRSDIEKTVLEGEACIDVWLERDGFTLACEISLTNTEENESGKIIRCLKAGIPKFAMVCADEKKLKKIADAITSNVEAGLAAKVEYFQPEQFIAHLKALPVKPVAKAEKISHGYKLKSSKTSASTAQQQAKEEAAIRAIAESMSKKKKQ
jgi:hypothetical protein